MNNGILDEKALIRDVILNRYSNIFLSVALVTVVITVVLYSRENYNNFLENNQQLAERSVDGTSREIEFFIDEKKRYVNLFADQEKRLLTNLIYSPQNEVAHQTLEDKIDVYFPDRFAFTLADRNGKPLLIRGKDLVGKACREDISLFSRGVNHNMIYVHPSPKTRRQHYDVMTSVQTGTAEKPVLFVSFFLDEVLRIIEHGTVNKHHQFLLKRGNPTIIELASKAALDAFRKSGHDFNLIPSVKANESRYSWPDSLDEKVVATGTVSGTHWELVDVVEPGVADDYIARLMVQAAGMLTLFAIVTLAGFWLTKRLGVLSGDTRIVLNSVEKERQRVAMDLHDQVLSDISHLRHDCQKLDIKDASVVSISEDLEQITNTIRHIIDDLHPQSIEILGLSETIRSYCKKHYQHHDMKVNMVVDNWREDALNQTEKLHIFRIFQEVIHNASKHSRASQCDIKLDMTSQKLILSVIDNGIGMPDGVNDSRGRGLTNVVSRARIIHARSFWNRTTEGTAFSLELVLRQPS